MFTQESKTFKEAMRLIAASYGASDYQVQVVPTKVLRYETPNYKDPDGVVRPLEHLRVHDPKKPEVTYHVRCCVFEEPDNRILIVVSGGVNISITHISKQ